MPKHTNPSHRSINSRHPSLAQDSQPAAFNRDDRMNRSFAYRSVDPRKSSPGRHKSRVASKIILVLLVIVVAGLAYGNFHTTKAANVVTSTVTKPVTTPKPATKPAPTPTPAPAPAPKPTTAATTSTAGTVCSSNTISQLVIVSISQRHMWACGGSQELYNNAVVTGMENLPADLTPTGTYTIYAKQTDLYLNGSDSTGSWHDYVNYWMPFLNNQYGEYGFHDATWRDPSAFGNISPDSNQASHGCVEMPLAAAAWLFNWAQIGTTITIQS